MNQLIIKDFEKQNILSSTEVAKLIKAVPPKHYAGLRTIIYKPAIEFRSMDITIEKYCKGAYYPEYQTIVIFDLDNKTLAHHVIYHELGHFVFHRVLNPAQRNKWTTKIRPTSQFLTPYAKTDPSEDFAESYALFITNPTLVRTKAPQKYNFLKTQVF